MARPALGKGLNSLITEMTELGEQIQMLPLSSLSPNPDQPRKYFKEELLKELAQSIKEKGIIQPLIVQKKGTHDYIIIAGERRYRASILAGLSKIPVIVKDFNEAERLEIAIIENVQREDLNAIEEARGYRSLMDSFGHTQEDIAKKIGKSRSAIANAIRLLRLPENVQKGILEQKITAGHARALLAINQEHQSKLNELYASIIANGLSVRATEEAAKIINQGANPPQTDTFKNLTLSQEKKKLLEIAKMEEDLIRLLGTKVEIKGSDEKGKIEIQYYNKDDLTRLYDLFLND